MSYSDKGLKMLIVSSYPPRKCGLATFSNDILNSIHQVFGDTLPIEICALENERHHFAYGKEVKYIINTNYILDYRETAELINLRQDIGLVCIQHEFGLYGGELGENIIPFLIALNKPIITIFHTVLPQPNETRYKLVRAIANLSERVIVLTKNAQKLLNSEYGIQNIKIKLVSHGTHPILWQQKAILKTKYNFENNIVLCTFGLISENKNIETVLYALPEIVAQYPEVKYLIIGNTHPEILKSEGEVYRNMLHKIVKTLNLEENVIFIKKYLELDKLLNYLTLTDIYLFSSKDPNQTVSGTFSYALSCGCAVISTPIPHAVEALDGGGLLLNSFNDPSEFKRAILKLIENRNFRVELGKKAYTLSHATHWPNIAIQYGLIFGEITNKAEDLRFSYPALSLTHIKELTTDFGMIQFSNFCSPDPSSGYTLDDNARALIDIVMYYNEYHDKKALKMANIYMSFIEYAQLPDGGFVNFFDFEGNPTNQNKEVNLEDSFGRAIWSLGTVIGYKNSLPTTLVSKAERCWNKAIRNIYDVESPRAISYIIKGLHNYSKTNSAEAISEHCCNLAEKLLYHFNYNSDENWLWFENYMTYANNVLPEALLYSYLVTGNKKFKEISIISFDFLLSHYFMKGQIKVVSNRTWFKKKNERSFYGEQPIEVATTIIALDLFYEVTGSIKYRKQMDLAFSWFLGNNHLNQLMYNTLNGASYDGLEDTEININQGAESTLCFFKTQLIMKKYLKRENHNLLEKSIIDNVKISKPNLVNELF